VARVWEEVDGGRGAVGAVGAPVGAESLPGLDDGGISNGLGVGDHLEGGGDGRGGPSGP
jgi:hypothetical protein